VELCIFSTLLISAVFLYKKLKYHSSKLISVQDKLYHREILSAATDYGNKSLGVSLNWIRTFSWNQFWRPCQSYLWHMYLVFKCILAFSLILFYVHISYMMTAVIMCASHYQHFQANLSFIVDWIHWNIYVKCLASQVTSKWTPQSPHVCRLSPTNDEEMSLVTNDEVIITITRTATPCRPLRPYMFLLERYNSLNQTEQAFKKHTFISICMVQPFL